MRLALLAALALAVPVSVPADGLLSVYFDTNASRCAGDVPVAGVAMLHVLLVAEGATYGGITGVEFRIDTSNARSYLYQNEDWLGAIRLGTALGDGVTMALGSCRTGSPIHLLSFQVLNPGSGAGDATLQVVPKRQPSNPNFACPLAVLCDAPVFSQVCVEGGRTILNPGAPRPCGSSRVDSQWTRVKELYRP